MELDATVSSGGCPGLLAGFPASTPRPDHRMDANGRHLRSLTSGADDDLFPTWTSAGKILFLRNGAVFSIDSDGGGLTRLSGIGTTHGDYALSPDGATIAVPSDTSDRLEPSRSPAEGTR
jgi:Tol biopolymer transport system component